MRLSHEGQTTMQFGDLVKVEMAPECAVAAHRQSIDTDSDELDLESTSDRGFVRALLSKKRRSTITSSRRRFLRGAVLAAGAGAVASVTRLGPAKRVDAQTSIVVEGQAPYRLRLSCPVVQASDNCSPGCSGNPVCNDCCDVNGWFRDGGVFTLRPAVCRDSGAIDPLADGWLWAFGSQCGVCSTVEYRCTDGYRTVGAIPFPYICRHVTRCGNDYEPWPQTTLGDEGTDPFLPPAAPTTAGTTAVSDQTIGAIESIFAVQGGFVVSGWIKGPAAGAQAYVITVDGTEVAGGAASRSRPEIQAEFFLPNSSIGFQKMVTGLSSGPKTICVIATGGGSSAQIGCAELTIVGGTGPDPTPTPTPVGNNAPFGAVEVVQTPASGGAFLSGYAADVDTNLPVTVEITINSATVITTPANLPRPDIATAFQVGPNTGFGLSVPLLVTGLNTICIRFIDPVSDTGVSNGCFNVTGTAGSPSVNVVAPGWGHAVQARGGIATARSRSGVIDVTGWVSDETDATRAAPYELVIDGERMATGVAASPSGHLTDAPSGNHGFEVSVTAATGTRKVALHALAADGSRGDLIDSTTVDVANSLEAFQLIRVN